MTWKPRRASAVKKAARQASLLSKRRESERLMNKFLPVLILATGLLTSCFSSSAPETSKNESAAEIEPLKVKFCELAKSPESYDGKKIILTGIYVLQYHSSNFFSLNCKSEKPIVISREKLQPCDEKSEMEGFDYSSAMT